VNVARVGIRQGRQSFVLILVDNARRQRLTWETLNQLHREGILHPDSEVAYTPYNELLLAIPAAVSDPESMVQAILEALIARIPIRLTREQMPAADLPAYDAFMVMARTQGGGDPRRN
jgi:hypothetical protein